MTVEESVVTTLPELSSTDTVGDGAKFVCSATPPAGWVVKTSLAAGPTVTTTEALLAAVRPPSVACRV